MSDEGEALPKCMDVWVVQAVTLGQYDQILREPGEVFQLINEPDGSMPVRMQRKYRMAERLNRETNMMERYATHEYTESVFLDASGNCVHRDFAGFDEQIPGAGKEFGGEMHRVGWMRRVPEHIVEERGGFGPDGVARMVGLYPPEQDFGSGPTAPVRRVMQRADGPTNAPRATPSRGPTQRKRQA